MVYCQVCKKSIATVHYTEIDVDYKVKKETHMCESCAQSHGLQGAAPKTLSPFQILEHLIKPNLPQQLKSLLESRCEECGMTYTEFRSGGRLGCRHDYQVFKEGIAAVLEQVQAGGRKHRGKIPRRAGAVIKLEATCNALRDELNDAIALEHYEQAAEIRDRLKQIEQELAERGAQPDHGV